MGNPIHPFPSNPGASDVSGRAGRSANRFPSAMADVVPTHRATRASSLSSLDGADAINQPILRSLPPSPARTPGHTLEEPPRHRRPARRSRPIRLFRSICRSLPVLTPRCGRLQNGPCRLPAPVRLSSADYHLSHIISSSGCRSGRRVTSTLFGYRKGRVALSLQETPRCLPSLVVELALQTHALLRELGTTTGARIVLESEKRGGGGGDNRGGSTSGKKRDHTQLLEEPMWTMFCNGKKTGYAVRREATDDDLAVMETLRAVSMGAGVLPGRSDVEGPEGEIAYMRCCFDHIVGSRDSESLYMVGPQGGNGPELAIFFVRL